MINKTVLIMAGGTGGHVFPGLALAEEMRSRGFKVEWLGTRAGIESRLVPASKIPLHFIPVKGVRGKRLLDKVLAPFNILSSVLSAIRILRDVKPGLVVGLGGFVAGPGGLGARILGLPLVIHEQNAVPGTTNTLLSKIASKVLTAFPTALARSECIGNPVRSVIESTASPSERIDINTTSIKLLILGGSRGAQAINEILPKALGCIKSPLELEVWHQAGAHKAETTQQDYEQSNVDVKNIHVKIEEFIDDISDAYVWADFVICRAGALTVSELAAVGVGALLIPFPYAIDDHQSANARYLAENGAALIKPQGELSAETLAAALEPLFLDKRQLLVMANKARLLAKRHAAKIFADRCEELIHA